MANPVPAYHGTVCDGCKEKLDEGEDLFFVDGERLCYSCAEDGDNVCECGSFKKSEFKTCYDCQTQ